MTIDKQFASLHKRLDVDSAVNANNFQQVEGSINKLDIRLEELEYGSRKLEVGLKRQDELIASMSDAYIDMSHKLDMVIEQTKEIPVIKQDITSINHHLTNIDHDIIDLRQGAYDTRLHFVKLEDKVDYLIDRMDKIGAQEYA